MTKEISVVVTQDRSDICEIISKMLDNPDEHEIYPTTQAYNELEELLKKVRLQAIGWTWAEACCQLDDGKDPRKYEVPELLPRAEKDLTQR